MDIKPDVIYDLVFWTVVCGLIGARLFYIFLNFDVYWADPKEIFMIQHGGLAYQGGFILGTVAAVIYLRRQRLSVLRVADLVAPYVALGHGIGRVGCLLNGCCYGRPFEWGISLPGHASRLHPTQIYEALALFLVFLILKKVRKFSWPVGWVFVLFLVLTALVRFVVEFFRGDHQTLIGGLSVFQWVSLGILAFGVILFGFLRKSLGSSGCRQRADHG